MKAPLICQPVIVSRDPVSLFLISKCKLRLVMNFVLDVIFLLRTGLCIYCVKLFQRCCNEIEASHFCHWFELRLGQSVLKPSGCSQWIELNGSVPIASVQVFASQTQQHNLHSLPATPGEMSRAWKLVQPCVHAVHFHKNCLY